MAASGGARPHRRLMDMTALALVIMVVAVARQAAATVPPTPTLTTPTCPNFIPANTPWSSVCTQANTQPANPCPGTTCCQQYVAAGDATQTPTAKLNPTTCFSQLNTIRVSKCNANGNRDLTINSVDIQGDGKFSHACLYNPATCLAQGPTLFGPDKCNLDTAKFCGKECKNAPNGDVCNYYTGDKTIKTTYTMPGGSCRHFVFKKASQRCGTYSGRLQEVSGLLPFASAHFVAASCVAFCEIIPSLLML
jgi:hypothetical protein